MTDQTDLSFDQSISLDDVAVLLNVPLSDVEAVVDPEDLEGLDYRDLTAEESAELQMRIDEILADDGIAAASRDALPRWQKGWAEVLESVRRDGVSMTSLTPQYFRHDTFRLGGRYIRAATPDFEQHLYAIIKSVIFEKYLSGVSHIAELGCGTGANLYALAHHFPDKRLTGCDWAEPSQALIREINTSLGTHITAVNLNLLTMDGWGLVEAGPGTGILTLHALEQIGADHGTLSSALRAARPDICVHLEPIAELYDTSLKYDQNALNYHNKRKYLSGFYDKLIEHETEGRVEILKAQRTGFGSTFQEAYSLIVWRVV
jgi:SAM-dependent methyltransferase